MITKIIQFTSGVYSLGLICFIFFTGYKNGLTPNLYLLSTIPVSLYFIIAAVGKTTNHLPGISSFFTQGSPSFLITIFLLLATISSVVTKTILIK